MLSVLQEVNTKEERTNSRVDLNFFFIAEGSGQGFRTNDEDEKDS